MTDYNRALAERLCAEAEDDGFNGRFFYDEERGDIAYIAKECDERHCDCEANTNADGDQDCSHSLYDWEGEHHINEPIVRMLNSHRPLVAQLRAALSEIGRMHREVEHARSEERTMRDVLRAEFQACQRMRPVYEAALRWRDARISHGGSVTRDRQINESYAAEALHDAIITAERGKDGGNG